MRVLSSVFAHIAVFAILAFTSVIVHLARPVRRIFRLRSPRREAGKIRLLLTGTFHNENWFRSHILPLSATKALERIYVVTDRPLFAVDKVSYACPPRWAVRAFGRTICRTALVFWVALRKRPDLLMGYHIMPNAVICLLAASVLGGRSIYQMTGGPIQIIGGGVGSENVLLCRLRRHSAILEKLLYHVVSLVDIVVVRGGRAEGFVRKHGLARQVAIVQGSVDTKRFCPNGRAKQYDLVLVARHIKEKQPHLFLETIEQLRRNRPAVRAALVGDGPLTEELKHQARRLGIEENVAFLGKLESVADVLAASRIFMLTSATEGFSIAMVEAMAAGLPVLAPPVGELTELLIDQENGIVINPQNVESTARQAAALLDDPRLLRNMSVAARERAVQYNSVPAVARRWDRTLSSWMIGECKV